MVDRRAGGRAARDVRIGGEEDDGIRADRAPPAQRALPGLSDLWAHRPEDLLAVTLGPGHREGQGQLLARRAAPPGPPIPGYLRPEHRHHPGAGHPAGWPRGHVRQLPRHYRLRRQVCQLLPHGRIPAVRRIRIGAGKREKGSEGRRMKARLGPAKTIQGLVRILRGRPVIPPSLADNELLRVILKRRSVRTFTAQPIPDDAFAAILEAGRLAPCTVNLQSWTFAVFDDAGWRQAFGRPIPFHGQRAVIVICDSHRYRSVLRDFSDYPLTEYTIAVMNASLAAMNMNIAAEALGISSVMLSETGRSGILDVKYLKETLNLPEGTVPLTTIVFGYARGPYPPMPPKLPMEHILLDGGDRQPDPATMQG
ncbi:nitroreductase family protein, partial [bacterium]